MVTVHRKSRVFTGQTKVENGYLRPLVVEGSTVTLADRQIFGVADGPMSGITPASGVGIYVDSDGTQHQYFSGAWH